MLGHRHKVVVVDDLSKPVDAFPDSRSFVPLDLTHGSGLDELVGECTPR